MSKFKSLALGCALIASPATAGPLEFSGITRETNPQNSSEINCREPSSCKLSRYSFGGVPIEWSTVSVDPETGKISFIAITFKGIYVDTARDALKAKYGEPTSSAAKEMTNKTGGPYTARVFHWRSFDSGDHMSLTDLDGEGGLMIWFPDPEAKAYEPKVDF